MDSMLEVTVRLATGSDHAVIARVADPFCRTAELVELLKLAGSHP